MGLKNYIAKKAVKAAINKIPENIDKQNQEIDRQNKTNSLISELHGTDKDYFSEKQKVNKLIVTYNSSKMFSSEKTYFVQSPSGITHYTAKIRKNRKNTNHSKIILYSITEEEVGRSEEDDSKCLFTIYANDWGALTFEKKFGHSPKYEISEKNWGYDAGPGILRMYDSYGNAIFQIQCSLSEDSEKAIIEYEDKKYEVIATLIGLSMYVIQH